MSSRLNTLAQYVHDSINGYRKAYDRADEGALKTAFARRIDRREEMLAQINAALSGMGEDRVTSGSTLGTFHDMWGALLNSIGGNDNTVASHVEEGEEFLRARFEDALADDDLPARERTVIEQSLATIRSDVAFIDQVERATAKA